MAPRIVIRDLAPEADQHLHALDDYLKESRLDPIVWKLAKIRASQADVDGEGG